MNLREPYLAETERIGIDTGGTFTDVTWISDGVMGFAKVPSRPDSPATAVLDGLSRAPGIPRLLAHGTTVGTNAVLSRTGGLSGMVVTMGFRDVLMLGRGDRRNLYSLTPSRHVPLVDRENIFEINLRLDSAGKILSRPSPDEIDDLLKKISRSGIQSLGVGILHSGTHRPPEQELSKLLEESLDIPVFSSSALTSYPREYERWSLCSLAAYLSPVLGEYLGTLNESCPCEVSLMSSSGGLMSGDAAIQNPAACVLSGPAGGALASKLTGRERVLALDIGGTSTDVTLIYGKLPRTRLAEIDGIPLPLPTIDIHTIGAGGGSLVWIDSGGMLAVGPKSAGAKPGPACYGNDGPLALSDIALVAGRLVPGMFLGGEMGLSPELSEEAISKVKPAGMSRDEFLNGVLELVTVHLTGALRKISVARGVDPSDKNAPFTLVPFGGAGAMFAVDCARELGLKEILHPNAAGVFSSIGLVAAPVAHESERAILCSFKNASDRIEGAIAELEDEITLILKKWGMPDEIVFFHTSECRYTGQSHALEIPFVKGTGTSEILRRFENAYRERYTYLHIGSPVEIVTVRVRGEIPAPEFEMPEISENGRNLKVARKKGWKLLEGGKWLSGNVYMRSKLPVDTPVCGPGVVVDDFSTVCLPSDSEAVLDKSGNMSIGLK